MNIAEPAYVDVALDVLTQDRDALSALLAEECITVRAEEPSPTSPRANRFYLTGDHLLAGYAYTLFLRRDMGRLTGVWRALNSRVTDPG